MSAAHVTPGGAAEIMKKRRMREPWRPPATRGHLPSLFSDAGFSLLEMVFVLVIVGIMATMASPLFSPGRWRSDTAAQELMMRLNSAQRKAVLRQHDIVVTFLLSDRALTILEDANNDGLPSIGENQTQIDLPETVGYGMGSAPALPEGAGPISFAPPSGDPTLTFHRNGSASTAGVIYIRPLEGSLASSAEAVRAVTVERATGELRCYSYRTGTWRPRC
ncbi:MAG: GspH/FimT family pseudopilin [Gemmatimonadota bacterium]